MNGVRRVVVVDDSPTTRAMLSALIDDHAQLAVVGQATNGKDAIEVVRRRRPDIITMDLQMPHMGGLEATERLMCEYPTPIVIVANSAHDAEVRASLEAMGLGALAILPKPRGPLSAGFQEDCDVLQRTLVTLADVRVVTRRPRAAALARRSTGGGLSKPFSGARAVALAASTGGPHVLREILSSLPRDLQAPVLLVQHFAPGFVQGLVQWLSESCALDVRLAKRGEPIRRGCVYVAPDAKHLGIERGHIHLDSSPAIGQFRPSADFLFSSVARAYGRHLFAAILTGMGQDGIAGLRDVRAVGGNVVAQDEATSVVYGMPRVAAEQRLVDAVLPPADIARAIIKAVETASGTHAA